jgi:hypothetical protein
MQLLCPSRSYPVLLRLFVSLRIALDTVPAHFARNICGFPGEMALSGKPRLHLVHFKLAAGINVSFFPPKSLVYRRITFLSCLCFVGLRLRVVSV